MMELARDMERLCPEAWLIQSGNPVFDGCTLMARETPIRVCGLCHGHFGYLHIVDELGLDLDRVDFEAPGVNHCIWMTRFHYDGEDAYPLIDRWIEEEGENYWATHEAGSTHDIQLSRGTIHQYRMYGLMPIGDTPRSGGWWYHTDIDTKKHWYGEPFGGPDTHIARPVFVERLDRRMEQIRAACADPEGAHDGGVRHRAHPRAAGADHRRARQRRAREVPGQRAEPGGPARGGGGRRGRGAGGDRRGGDPAAAAGSAAEEDHAGAGAAGDPAHGAGAGGVPDGGPEHAAVGGAGEPPDAVVRAGLGGAGGAAGAAGQPRAGRALQVSVGRGGGAEVAAGGGCGGWVELRLPVQAWEPIFPSSGQCFGVTSGFKTEAESSATPTSVRLGNVLHPALMCPRVPKSFDGASAAVIILAHPGTSTPAERNPTMSTSFTASVRQNPGRRSLIVDFRHPLRLDPSNQGKPGRKVRRGLGTDDRSLAEGLVDQLNLLLADPTFHSPTARVKAAALFDPRVVEIFYDGIGSKKQDYRALRDEHLPFPPGSEGYPRILLLGVPGAGKTTLVRQLIGSHPDRDRFPSTSVNRTTTCQTEVITGREDYSAAITFMSEEEADFEVRQNLSGAVLRAVDAATDGDIAKVFLERSDGRFRLKYLLSDWPHEEVEIDPYEDQDDDNGQVQEDQVDSSPFTVSPAETEALATKLRDYVGAIREITSAARNEVEELQGSLDTLTPDERNTALDWIQEIAEQSDAYAALAGELLDDLREKSENIPFGRLLKTTTGWPRLWLMSAPVEGRKGVPGRRPLLLGHRPPSVGQAAHSAGQWYPSCGTF